MSDKSNKMGILGLMMEKGDVISEHILQSQYKFKDMKVEMYKLILVTTGLIIREQSKE